MTSKTTLTVFHGLYSTPKHTQGHSLEVVEVDGNSKLCPLY